MEFRRGQTNARRFRTSHSAKGVSIASSVSELLESRQLLSAVSNSVVSQTISVSVVVPDGGDGFIRIEEVRQVGSEIYVLSRIHQSPSAGATTTTVQEGAIYPVH